MPHFSFLKTLVTRHQTSLPLSTNIPSPPSFDPFDPALAQVYRYRRQVGVNLGCVFLLERWLCPPRLCEKVGSAQWESEHDFLRACRSPQEARRILEDHWETHVTQDNMAQIASKGINTIRLPIGYWIVRRSLLVEPFKSFEGVYDAAWNWFLRLINMAAQYGIGVLVDLHGAPGGQNSDIHCGVSTGRAEFFDHPHYQEVTLEVLWILARTLTKINNVVGLELLNEPIDHPNLQRFYENALSKLSHPDTIGLPVYVSDCWNTEKYASWLQSRPYNGQLVVMDTHQYFCHTPDDHAKSALQHTQDLNGRVRERLKAASDQLGGRLVVGEWSVVLNHQSIPAHANDGNVMRDFGQAESRVWEAVSAGSFYWNYRAGDDGWFWSFVYCQATQILPVTPIIQLDMDLLDVNRQIWLQQAFEQHKKYWSARNCPQVMEYVNLFQDGYRIGFEVAQRFGNQKSRVGFVQPLLKVYKKQHGLDVLPSQAWQFDHGFLQAIDKVWQANNNTSHK